MPGYTQIAELIDSWNLRPSKKYSERRHSRVHIGFFGQPIRPRVMRRIRAQLKSNEKADLCDDNFSLPQLQQNTNPTAPPVNAAVENGMKATSSSLGNSSLNKSQHSTKYSWSSNFTTLTPTSANLDPTGQKPLDNGADNEPKCESPSSPTGSQRLLTKESNLLKRRMTVLTRQMTNRVEFVEKTETRLEANDNRIHDMQHELRNIEEMGHSSTTEYQKQREWELHQIERRLMCTTLKQRESCLRGRKVINELLLKLDHAEHELAVIDQLKSPSQSRVTTLAPLANVAPYRWSAAPIAVARCPELTNLDPTWKDVAQDEAKKIMAHSPRTAIRLALLKLCDGTEAAFARLKYNPSDVLTSSEFMGSLDSMRVPWREILRRNHVPSPKVHSVFALFDVGNKGSLRIHDLFPSHMEDSSDSGDEFQTIGDLSRLATPLAWDYWCFMSSQARFGDRKPKWYVDRHGIAEIVRNQTHSDIVADRRHWMQQTMRSLKSNGLTDAACRELVALHLPRGMGPKDSHGCKLLDAKTVQMVRKRYMEGVNLPSKRIQKHLTEFSWQRQELYKARIDLFNVTEKLTKEKQEAELISPIDASERPAVIIEMETNPEKMTEQEKRLLAISVEHSIPLTEIRECLDIFVSFGSDDLIGMKRTDFHCYLRSLHSGLKIEVVDKKWTVALHHYSITRHSGILNQFAASVATCASDLKNARLPLTEFLLWSRETNCGELR